MQDISKRPFPYFRGKCCLCRPEAAVHQFIVTSAIHVLLQLASCVYWAEVAIRTVGYGVSCLILSFQSGFPTSFQSDPIIMSGKKRKLPEGEEADYVAKPPRTLSNMHLRNQEKRLIIILEQAQLESAKVFPSKMLFYPINRLTCLDLLDVDWQGV